MKKIITFFLNFFKILIIKILFFKKIRISYFCNFHGRFEITVKGKETHLIIPRTITTRNGFACRVSGGGYAKIGENCFFNYNCMIASMKKIIIGDNCIFGNNVTIIDHDHNYKSSNRKHEYLSSEILIGENSWIGANVVILRGTKIGKGCVIGAGTVVRGVIPDNSLVTGSKELNVKSINYEN